MTWLSAASMADSPATKLAEETRIESRETSSLPAAPGALAISFRWRFRRQWTEAR